MKGHMEKKKKAKINWNWYKVLETYTRDARDSHPQQ